MVPIEPLFIAVENVAENLVLACDSIFFGFHTDEKTIYRVLKALAEGNGIRACARIFDIDKKTVIRILDVAGEHCQQIAEQLIGNYHLQECQLDELWSFVKKRKRV